MGLFWKCARIGACKLNIGGRDCALTLESQRILADSLPSAGERLSPYVSLACVVMAVKILIST